MISVGVVRRAGFWRPMPEKPIRVLRTQPFEGQYTVMTSTESRDVLVRAAREMLRWDQKRLAALSGVGLITVRRFETGTIIGEETIEMLLDALRKAGVAFIGRTTVDGVTVREGVALEPHAKRLRRPPKRKRRTPEQILADAVAARRDIKKPPRALKNEAP